MNALKPFADFTAALDAAPRRVLHAAKRCLVDYFAAMLPGAVTAPGPSLRASFEENLGRGQALLYPDMTRTDSRTAAFLQGAASHTVEFDDIYRDGIYHPGAPVISAALAIGQSRGITGQDLLLAIIAGYEVSNRIAAAVNPAHYEFWHTTGTVGHFGAAAAASRVLKLDAGRTAHALANAGTFASGLQQAFRADAHAKPLHSGQAASVGVTCALSAEQGVTGARDILEGPRGFGMAMCRNAVAEAPDWDAAGGGLGTDWTITRTTQKNHAACGHAHAAIDGVKAIMDAERLVAPDIAEIHVGSYQKAVEITGSTAPRTAFEAKFSLPYCVAAQVLMGSVRTAAFLDDALANPALRQIMGKVSLTEDNECQSVFPAQRSAKVRLVTPKGRTFTHHAKTRKGDPDAPLTDEEISAKFMELTEPVIAAGAAPFLDLLWQAGAVRDIRHLTVPARASRRHAPAL